MDVRFTRLGLIALTLGLSSTLTLSQGGALPQYARFGAGARPAGLGGAFTAMADDANSAFWNASSMAIARGPELTGTHTNSYMGTTFDYVAGIMPFRMFAHRSSFGFYYVRTITTDIPITDPRSDTTSGSWTSHSGSFENTCLAVAFALGIFDRIRVGATANLVRTRLLDAVAAGRGFDIGISLDMTQERAVLGETSVAVQIRDLASHQSWSNGFCEKQMPYLLLGVAHRPWISSNLRLSADFERMTGRSNLVSDWRCGLEFLMIRVVPLRFGYDGESVAIGVGCRGGHIRLDYALSFHRELAESHCVSLTFAG